MGLTNRHKGSIAFVIPWLGEHAVGGAELECLNTAMRLKEAGIEIEVLTTCIKNFSSPWDRNFYKEGIYNIQGIRARRFPVQRRNAKLFHRLNKKIDFASCSYTPYDFSGRCGHVVSPLSREEEDIFMDEMFKVPSLYSHLKENADIYDYIVFIPYMFSTSYYGTLICGEKSVIIPCLHQNELNAYMKCYRTMFNLAGKIIYHTPSEEELACRLYGITKEKGKVIGEGVCRFSSSGERFREKYSINYPFILYVGRQSEGKNTHALIDYFSAYKTLRPASTVKLLLIGEGSADIPAGDSDYIKNMGALTDQDKFDAYAASAALCQPSMRESFSLVLMEAWLAETPAIVNEMCDVTKQHCEESNGGLYFSNRFEFFHCIDFILKHPEAAEKMGKNGKQYVEDRFNWDRVISSYLGFLL